MSCGGDTAAYDLLLLVGDSIQLEGGDAAITGNYHGEQCWFTGYNDTALRFKSIGPSIAVYTYLDGNVIRYAVDGVDTAAVTKPASSAWGWQTVATGLDTGAEHTYLISYSGNSCAHKCLSTGGSGLNTDPLPVRDIAAFWGDSITAGVYDGDTTVKFSHLTAMNLGMQCANRGASGATVASYGQSQTAVLTAMSPQPYLVVDMFGINDIDVTTLPNFYTAMVNMLTAIRAGLPTAYILVEGIMYVTGFGLTHQKVDDFNTQKEAAVTAMADSRIVYRTGARDARTTETLHPEDGECILIAAAVAADAAAFMAVNVSISVTAVAVTFNSPAVSAAISAPDFDSTTAAEYVLRFVFPRPRPLVEGE